MLALYDGTCGDLAERACTDRSAGCSWSDPELDVVVAEGERLLVRVGGTGDQDGELELTLSFLPCRPVFELEIIGAVPNHLDASALAVAPSGEIVGMQANGHGYTQGFRWSEADGYQLVAPAGGQSASTLDVNAAGTAVGWISFSTTLISPAIAEGLVLEQLSGLPGKVVGRARAINEAGVIVGELAASTSSSSTPVQWADRVPSELPTPIDTDRATDINDIGSICGTGKDHSAPYQEGWVLLDGNFQWIPSPVEKADVFVRAINNLDQACGELLIDNSPTPPVELGFVWHAGAFTVIEPSPPHESTDVYDITDGGVLVGHLDATSGAARPYVQRGTVPVPINSRLLQLEDPLITVRAISEDGVIVGSTGTSAEQPARVIPVPPNGDLDCDGLTDAADLGRVLAAWGPCPRNTACGEDMNVDGVVDGADLGIVLGNWGPVR